MYVLVEENLGRIQPKFKPKLLIISVVDNRS